MMIVFRLRYNRPSGLRLVVLAALFAVLTTILWVSSFVSLSQFSSAVPRREGFGKHSYMSSTFAIAILNAIESSCQGRVDDLAFFEY